MKEYFNIAFAQIKLTLDYDNGKEYLIEDEAYLKQMNQIVSILQNKNNLDIIIFPEMSYHASYEKFLLEYSINKLIVFGSVYIDNTNFTVVYHKQNKYLIKKMFTSAIEPSVRYNENISSKEFLKTNLKEHTFKLYNKKLIVLNCAEYYKVAYYIARDNRLSKNLFGFLVPCANNNNEVFIAESIALHNHNENIYSFVVNSSSTYKGKKYSLGGSFVFGIMSRFEAVNSFENRLNHPSNICYLDDGAYLVEGMYLFNNASTFYRSDNFRHSPKNMKITSIL